MGLRWVDIFRLVLDNTRESAYLTLVVSYSWNREPLNLATLSYFVVYVSVYAAHDRCDNQSREVGPDTLLQTYLETT